MNEARTCSDCSKEETDMDLEFEEYSDNGLEELLCMTCLNKRTPTNMYLEH